LSLSTKNIAHEVESGVQSFTTPPSSRIKLSH
jgi:hypothetical protein